MAENKAKHAATTLRIDVDGQTDAEGERAMLTRLRGRAPVVAAMIVLAFATSGCTLWGWGNNLDGQVGDGTSNTRLSPSPAPPIFDEWSFLNTGEFHACGIRFDESLWCWGRNAHGQLGADLPNSQALPVRVVGSATWSTVDAGGSFTCAVRTAETLWCWGHNGNAQLGDGTTTPHPTPVQIGTAAWQSVTASNTGVVDTGDHTCGIQTNGTLWCWGTNGSGQLGDGTNSQRLSPVQVGTATWSNVSAGANHTCGIQTNGTLWCWGSNGTGRLGDGTTMQRDAPVQIGSAQWKLISAARDHTCGIQTNGTLWCWGSSNSGQVGAGGLGSHFAPVQIGSATWRSVSAGAFHTCGVRVGNTLWCWGDNTIGQVGIGTQTPTMPVLTPTQVGTGTDWHMASAGWSHTNALRLPQN